MSVNASKLDNNKIGIQHNIIAITELSVTANHNNWKGLTDQWEARTVTQFITFWAEWCCQATHKSHREPQDSGANHNSSLPPNSLHSPHSLGLFAKLSRATAGARQSQQIVSDAELWYSCSSVPGGNKVVAIKQNHITTSDNRVNWD